MELTVSVQNMQFDKKNFYIFLHGKFSIKNESTIPSRIRERNIMRADSNRIRRNILEGCEGSGEGKEKKVCV